MQCPACGSSDVHRSRRRWHERLFNWLLWFHQRPYRCSRCKTRFWVRLTPRAWRRTMGLRFNQMTGRWHWYLGVWLLIVLTAWMVSSVMMVTVN